MLNNKSLYMLGYGFGLAGAESGSSQGPMTIQSSTFLSRLSEEDVHLKWGEIFQSKQSNASVLTQVTQLCGQLADSTAKLTIEKKPFVVLGGDHTSAIGTWSGVSYAKRNEGALGLIWIDAHMDSHTPETTQSGNLHGMPLACLLGYGDKLLTEICDDLPKIKPENLCLIGIRSFEKAEEALLKKLNVKIFYMDEVKERGMANVLKEAIRVVTQNTTGFGISIDIDSMDPRDAPGTGVAEPNGIAANDLCSALTRLAADSRLIGLEIAEFDPSHDHDHMTERLVIKLISAVTLGKTS